MIPKLSTVGGMAVGIPGAVAGILEVHKKMGTLPLKQLMQPAIDCRKRLCCYRKQAKSFKRYSELFVEVNGKDTFFAKEHQAGGYHC